MATPIALSDATIFQVLDRIVASERCSAKVEIPCDRLLAEVTGRSG